VTDAVTSSDRAVGDHDEDPPAAPEPRQPDTSSNASVLTRPATVGEPTGPTARARAVAVLDVVTPTGRLALGVAVGSWVLGWWFGWLEMMVIAAVAATSMVVAVVFVFGRAQLRVELEVLPQRVVVGERSAGQLTVHNGSGHRLLPLRVELVVGDGSADFDIPSLRSEGSHDEVFVLPTERRAVIPVGPATSVRGDPVGLLRRAVPLTEPVPLFVHPRTVGLGGLGAGFLRDLEGQATATLTSSDLAFHALRDYVPGDDRRFIHWMTTARVGHLVVRQFIETRRSHLAVVIDGSPASYLDDDEFELAVSIAASLGVRTLRDEQELTVLGAGHHLACASGPLMLDELAGIELGGARDGLVPQLEQLRRVAVGVSVAMLVTGSRASIADLRAAAARLPVDVTTYAVRAGGDGATGFRPVGNMHVLTVAELSELPHLLWAVTDV